MHIFRLIVIRIDTEAAGVNCNTYIS